MNDEDQAISRRKIARIPTASKASENILEVSRDIDGIYTDLAVLAKNVPFHT